MILSDVLGRDVLDENGVRVGQVNDVRFVIDGRPGQLLADARVYGLVISPHSRVSYLGYERSGVDRPALIARFLAWRHRGSFLVEWPDVALIGRDAVRLRAGYERLSPVLPTR
ncbi:MAG: PRC-barrel domain-containing protein [Microbacteriaceae bacterium]